MENIFYFKWDIKTVLITVFASILIVSSIVFVLYLLFSEKRLTLFFQLFLFLILAGSFSAIIYGLVNMPICIKTTAEQIEIHQLLRVVIIPKKDINTITILDSGLKGETIRLFGSGGFFGHFGKFQNNHIGKFNMYSTSMTDLTLIQLIDGRNIVVSISNGKKI